MNACSLWFDSIGPWNWHQCCVLHDQLYASGIVTKMAADAALEHCVNAILPGMGAVMFLGVSTPIGWLFWWRARLRNRR
jgi:hypothetical protein